jgi:hypothetical protein
MLWIGVSGCDEGTSDDEVERALPCNLADEECAALPEAAEAFAVLESMDIDPDEANVELVEGPHHVEAEDPADEPWSADALKSEEPPPQEQKFSCSGNDSATCCCFWDGDYWGCGCF